MKTPTSQGQSNSSAQSQTQALNLKLRASQERGYFENEWLKSYHSFSFADYFDPNHIQFHTLRVINHDFVAPGTGFPRHPHKDMEIMTYVLKGAVEHQDSLGNKEQIRAGEVQIMSAGKGIFHSEVNPSSREELELLQIWILPEARSLTPRYEQKIFSRESKLNRLQLLASPEAQQGSLKIFQNVQIFGSILEAQNELSYTVSPERAIWIQLARGGIKVNGLQMKTGDGLAIEGSGEIKIQACQESDFILFDSVKN